MILYAVHLTKKPGDRREKVGSKDYTNGYDIWSDMTEDKSVAIRAAKLYTGTSRADTIEVFEFHQTGRVFEGTGR